MSAPCNPASNIVTESSLSPYPGRDWEYLQSSHPERKNEQAGPEGQRHPAGYPKSEKAGWPATIEQKKKDEEDGKRYRFEKSDRQKALVWRGQPKPPLPGGLHAPDRPGHSA